MSRGTSNGRMTCPELAGGAGTGGRATGGARAGGARTGGRATGVGISGVVLVFLATLLCVSAHSRAAVYEVGPGQTLAAIGDVPWESLAAGDEVRIHYRATPYAEKIIVCVAGTQAQPVVIRGMPGPGGELPVITGENATTRPQTNYWSEQRGVIKVGGANSPSCDEATWVVIQDLEVRSARPPFSFTGRNGLTSYPNNAASVFVERAQHLVLRNLRLHDSGNGLFVAASGGDTQDILVEGCHIFGNGNEGSIYEHNSYTAARGILFHGNHYGPLRDGCGGNNLKDRSAGLVVRYNFIESGNRQLDLVDAEDSAVIQDDPRYRETFVYGNVLVEPDGAGNSQIVHYGGDSGNTAIYRKGTLYFHHNTVISTRSGNTTWFRLSSNDEAAEARNNIVYVTAAGTSLGLLDATGHLAYSHNWLKTGYRSSHGTLSGTVQDGGSNITGSEPGFAGFGAGDYQLASGSPCIDSGGDLPAAVLPDHAVLLQYVPHQGTEPRPLEPPPDIGAYERCVSGSCSPQTPDGGVGSDAGPGADAGPGSDGGIGSDAGPGADAGPGSDAAVGGDAGPPPGDPKSTGCGCGVVSRGADQGAKGAGAKGSGAKRGARANDAGALAWVLVVFGLVTRRARRRRAGFQADPEV